jgi:predicted GH43/DUF377 family glycosyl hydrolase/predicted RNA-binding Zn-ribbon protein involved in translation (DUF1610 family)
MWYNGVNQQGKFVGIGYATSTDGKTWIANAQPVLTANAYGWEQSSSALGGIGIGTVLWSGSEFLMWYRGPDTSGNGAIGLATSPDGVNWTRSSGNPVLTASSVDSSSIQAPSVIQADTGFKMWYACQNPSLSYEAICYATSNDGVTWNKYPSPVLTADIGDWESAGLYSPSVIYDGTVYRMWYTGNNAGGYGPYFAIGEATSQDGITWTKDPNNPILSAGPSGAWDQNGAENPCVIQYKGGFLMFYDGAWQVNYNWPLAYIGMAHSPYFTLGVSVPDQVSVTLDGTQESAGSTSLQLSPGVHTISVPNMVQIDSTSRLKFNGWSDGSTQLTRTLDVESDTQLSVTYVTQYLVNATTDSTLQSGWYDQGTVLQLNVTNQLLNSYRLFTGGFDGWYNNGQLVSKSPSASLTVDGPVNLTDSWNYLPYLPPVLIVVIVAVILFLARRGTIPISRKMPQDKRSKRTRSKSKVEAVTSKPEKQVAHTAEVKEAVPISVAKTTMYCPQCGAVISRDSKFCKECGTKL